MGGYEVGVGIVARDWNENVLVWLSRVLLEALELNLLKLQLPEKGLTLQSAEAGCT